MQLAQSIFFFCRINGRINGCRRCRCCHTIAKGTRCVACAGAEAANLRQSMHEILMPRLPLSYRPVSPYANTSSCCLGTCGTSIYVQCSSRFCSNILGGESIAKATCCLVNRGWAICKRMRAGPRPTPSTAWTFRLFLVENKLKKLLFGLEGR